jgi:hypothetical protein
MINVTRYRPETRQCEVKVCRYITEERSEDVEYTVCVPQERTRTCQVTRYEIKPEQQTVKYTACVPYTYTEKVPVTVRKMVCKTVEVPGCCCN